MSFTSGGSGGSVTPANPLQFALQNGMLALTTSMRDMPGLNFTLAAAGVYLVSCAVDVVLQSGDDGATVLAQLLVDGVAQPNDGILTAPNALMRATIAQQWQVKASAGTVIKMQVNKSAGTGPSSVTMHSSLSALWVSP